MMRAMLRAGRALGAFGLLRLLLAVILLWVVASDTGPRLARIQFATLPDFDYAAEVKFLRTAGRYGEAIIVADAGLEALTDAESIASLERQRALALAEQQSFLRRAQEAGLGALSGRGASIESLVGAVAADFFIVGDVRDLALEGGRYALDGDADEVILALSALGIITTFVPCVDWAPAILKFARRAGTLTMKLAGQIMQLARAGRRTELTAIFHDIRRLSRHASPGGAARLLRHADSTEDLTALANFLERNRRGAFALHVTGKDGAELVKRAARTADTSVDASHAVIAAAGKGQNGAAWLRKGGWRAMTRPHLLVGVGKGLWKGNMQDLTARIAALLDPHARWLLPLLAMWVFVELALLARHLSRWRLSPRLRDPQGERSPFRPRTLARFSAAPPSRGPEPWRGRHT